MSNEVEHAYGIEIGPALEEMGEERWDFDDYIVTVNDCDRAILGVTVPTSAKGIVVTEEVEAAARLAISALPKDVMERVAARMAGRIERYWDIPLEVQAQWRSGRMPEPTFHVIPYWG